MTTLTPPKHSLGNTQKDVLNVLKKNATGLTPPALRDAIGLDESDYGTRRAHAVLGRLASLGLVTKEEMSEKVAANNAHPITGRVSKYRFKITADGKQALKRG